MSYTFSGLKNNVRTKSYSSGSEPRIPSVDTGDEGIITALYISVSRVRINTFVIGKIEQVVSGKI